MTYTIEGQYIDMESHRQRSTDLRIKRTGGLVWGHSNELIQTEEQCLQIGLYHHLKAKCFSALEDLEQGRHSLTAAHAFNPDLRWKSLEDPAFDLIFGKDPTI